MTNVKMRLEAFMRDYNKLEQKYPDICISSDCGNSLVLYMNDNPTKDYWEYWTYLDWDEKINMSIANKLRKY